MSQPITVDISDDDDDIADGFSGKHKDTVDLSTPLSIPPKKKQRSSPEESSSKLNPTVFISDDDIDDYTTPFKPSKSTPSIVLETPMSNDFSKSDVSFVKCSSILHPKSSGLDLTPSMVAETPALELPKYSLPIVRHTKAVADSQNFSSSIFDHNYKDSLDLTPSMVAETPALELPKYSLPIVRHTKAVADSQNFSSSIFDHNYKDRIDLESDNESDSSGKLGSWQEEEQGCSTKAIVKEIVLSSRPFESTSSLGSDKFMRMAEDVSYCNLIEDGPSENHGYPEQESYILEPKDGVSRLKGKGNSSSRNSRDETTGKTRMSVEERLRLKEEKKQQKEREKLQKAAQKAEAAEMKKRQKEKQKWEKGKFAHKSIVAQIDCKAVELGAIGGHLLTRLAEKGLSYQITKNPIDKSIVWSMSVPEEISQISSEVIEVPYVLIICEAEEFCNLVNNESLMNHLSRVQRLYPLHTVCYLTNKLMAFINKREQGKYKDPANHTSWKRPPIEEVLSNLTINFSKVHSRHCVDEAELAEHVVGLTGSLASCQFRNKLTRLSVNANGSLIPKGCVERNRIQKSPWLKALLAIPKVQPRFAIAISNKYPTMKSLLRVYMDPSKTVHEKEFLLTDLRVEGLLGDDRRLGEICSKRVYRILMAESGSSLTDDIECGADFFSQHSP